MQNKKSLDDQIKFEIAKSDRITKIWICTSICAVIAIASIYIVVSKHGHNFTNNMSSKIVVESNLNESKL